ncbi:PilN domain-containing protein [Methylomonas sp. SURF-2]|uniref:PilN domain-containing protein n=1 Tax=Methylomonas subterranea TaxID=2952225 RepID=A0ABT1TF97_9GAMM|nr:PilN domain-containing protein [Methylomonas sp. SURF-2]MCQ8104141.1 PilN domain-containing protein [Methylomonas sp. SURF-2]
MARINLLPWREELRKKQQQDFAAGIGAAVVATIVVLGLVYLYIEGLKEHQNFRNQMLKNEIAVLDKKIAEIKDIEDKKNKLLTKIDVIQKLQESRPEIVHLFDEMAKVTPEGIYLTKFVQVETTLTLDGKAESNARISAYMRAIDNSEWLHSPVLGVIKGEGKSSGQMNDFSMTAKQGRNAADDQTGAAK